MRYSGKRFRPRNILLNKYKTPRYSRLLIEKSIRHAHLLINRYTSRKIRPDNTFKLPSVTEAYTIIASEWASNKGVTLNVELDGNRHLTSCKLDLPQQSVLQRLTKAAIRRLQILAVLPFGRRKRKSDQLRLPMCGGRTKLMNILI